MVALMNIEAEILDLKRRVGDLESALNVLTGQLRLVHPELVTLREETGGRLEKVSSAVTAMDHRLGKVEVQVWSLRDDLPEIVQQAVKHAIIGPPAGRASR